MIGAYAPEGQYSLCRAGDLDAYVRGLQTTPNVPVPKTDPVHGANGPLCRLWTR